RTAPASPMRSRRRWPAPAAAAAVVLGAGAATQFGHTGGRQSSVISPLSRHDLAPLVAARAAGLPGVAGPPLVLGFPVSHPLVLEALTPREAAGMAAAVVVGRGPGLLP
ncbi:MAG: hypothetical protein ACR2KV_15960, partial [Solirubrobacteraceae bacterium]